MERLLPHEIGTKHFYLDYLKEYSRRNGMDYVASSDGNPKPKHWALKSHPVDDVTRCSWNGDNALTAAAKFQFMSRWNNQPVPNMKCMSRKIQERACLIICTRPEFSQHAAASFVEAALACELLRRRAEATDRVIILCNCIHQCALSLMNLEGYDCDASAAAMVGVAKEVRKMCDWMGKENRLNELHSYSLFHEMGLCDMIRMAAMYVIKHILSSSREQSPSWAVILEARDILKVYREIVVSKVDRISNGIAHVLAQLGKAGLSGSLSNDAPDCVRELLLKERL
ncbi:hypothetical protein ACQ4PT_025582 [Festuca glaucescens]